VKAIPIVIALGAVALASWLRRRRRAGDTARHTARRPARLGEGFGHLGGVVALVAAREIRERLRGRLFRAGTLFVLLAVGAAIVIPTIHKGAHQPQRVGVVGALAAPMRSAVVSSARAAGTTVRFVAEAGEAAARSELGTGRIDLAVVDGRVLLVENAIGPSDTSQAARFVLDVANQLGVLAAVDAARLSPLQAATLARARPLAIGHIHAGPRRGAEDATSLVGLVLIFVMLTQYNTWTLIGVMEEKSSRVIEVLLATVRPIQLLTGKVLGIGLLALAQATLIVVFAIGLAGAVGSSLLHGTAPLAVLSTLAWLLLGYAFYSWVYAAAGSMAERQDQVQALVLPLSLPVLFGYIAAFTAIGSGSASLLVKVLAYLPPTAPFEMPVLVGLGAVTWWEFLASALISIAATLGTAKLAAGIYRRAILRTGGRVRVRDVLARAGS
jgi:ABC-2 type transport system permease protein